MPFRSGNDAKQITAPQDVVGMLIAHADLIRDLRGREAICRQRPDLISLRHDAPDSG